MACARSACAVSSAALVESTLASCADKIGLRSRNGRLLRLDTGRLLHVLRPHQQLALGNVVAFLDQNFSDLPDGIGIDVGLVLFDRFDFAIGGHNLGQILALTLPGLHLHHAAMAPQTPADRQTDKGCDGYGHQNVTFFHFFMPVP